VCVCVCVCVCVRVCVRVCVCGCARVVRYGVCDTEQGILKPNERGQMSVGQMQMQVMLWLRSNGGSVNKGVSKGVNEGVNNGVNTGMNKGMNTGVSVYVLVWVSAKTITHQQIHT